MTAHETRAFADDCILIKVTAYTWRGDERLTALVSTDNARVCHDIDSLMASDCQRTLEKYVGKEISNVILPGASTQIK